MRTLIATCGSSRCGNLAEFFEHSLLRELGLEMERVNARLRKVNV